MPGFLISLSPQLYKNYGQKAHTDKTARLSSKRIFRALTCPTSALHISKKESHMALFLFEYFCYCFSYVLFCRLRFHVLLGGEARVGYGVDFINSRLVALLEAVARDSAQSDNSF